MILGILIILIVLWILGFINLPLLSQTVLFNFAGINVRLYDLIIFGIIVWVIGLLPSPFREIATVILVLWLLSFFGVIAIAGFSQLLLIALIVGLGIYLLRGNI